MRLRLLLPLMAAIALGCSSESPVGTEEGNKAPDFTVKAVGKEEKVSLASLKGKVVLIDFWATWCGPCRQLEPEVQELYEKYREKGFDVVAVSSEPAELLEKFAKSRKHSYPIYQDFAGMANGAYKVDSLPTQVIVGKDGNIAWKQVGMAPGTLTEAVDKVMASS